jgi:hypothetical protein
MRSFLIGYCLTYNNKIKAPSAKEKPSLKVIFFDVSVHKNQSRFEWPPIRKQYFEILIDFKELRWQKN